jgi:chromosome segregation ATPase
MTASTADSTNPAINPTRSAAADLSLDPLTTQATSLIAALSQRMATLHTSEQATRERAAHLDARERELVDRLTALQRDHAEQARQLAEHKDRCEQDLVSAHAQLAQQRQQLDVAAAKLASDQTQLQSEQAALQTAQAAVERDRTSTADQAKLQSHQLQQLASQLEQRRVELEARREELERYAADATARLEAAQAAQAAAAQAQSALQQLQTRQLDLDAREQQLAETLAELERRRQVVAQNQEAAARTEVAAKQLHEEAQQVRFTTEQENRRLRAQVSELTARAQSLAQSLAEAAATPAAPTEPDPATEATIQSLRQALQEAQSARASADRLLADERAAFAAAQHQLTQQLSQQHTQQHASVEHTFATELQTLRAALETRDRTLIETERKLDEAQGRATIAERSLAQASASSGTADERLAAAQQRIDQLNRKLFDAQSELATLRESAANLSSQRPADESTLAQPTLTPEQHQRLLEALSERESALRALADRLATANARAEEALARAEGAQAGLADARAASITSLATPTTSTLDPALRRQRLARARQLLAERRLQTQALARTLKGKELMAERVIEQRVQSALAAHALTGRSPATPDQPPTPASATSLTLGPASTIPGAGVVATPPRSTRAGAIVAAAVIAAGAAAAYLTHLSVGAAIPSTYAARTTINADTGGLAPVASELEVWKFRHINMLTEDLVFGLAAESLARQGITDLGRMDRIRSVVSANLTYNADRPGELTLQLKSDSPQQAELVLRTFAESLRAHANSRRFSNAVTYTTAVADPAKALPEAIAGPGRFREALAALVGVVTAIALGIAAVVRSTRKPAKATARSTTPSTPEAQPRKAA